MDGGTNNVFPETADGRGALPRAPVLAYLANVSTPTRARTVAALGTLVVAAGNLMLGLGIVVLTVWQVYRLTWRWRVAPTWTDYWEEAQRLDSWFFYRSVPWGLIDMVLSTGITTRIVLLAVLWIPALVLVILARDVYFGRRAASSVSLVMVMPVILVVALLTAIAGGGALVYGFGRVPERAALWLLLVVPPGALLVLVLMDLCSYLRWIARAPLAEKPPVAFLPAKRPA